MSVSSFNPDGRRYFQVQSLRDVTSSNFNNGQIRFHWSIPAMESWNPSLSFFTIRSSLAGYTAYNGKISNGIQMVSGIAPAMFFNDSLWQQIEFKINGITINKQDNYCHQIAALKYRLENEDKNQSIEKLNFPDADVYDRASKIGVKGYGDARAEAQSVDWFTEINHLTTVQIPAVVAGGVATLTIALGGQNLLHDFAVGDRVIIQYDAGDRFEAVLTAVTDLTFQYISPVAGSINAGGAAILVAGQIWKTGRIRRGQSDAPNYQNIETLWKPKLGFFDLDQWLPGGDYEIILTPFPASSFKFSAFEIDPLAPSNPVSDINFEIINMEYNFCGRSKPSALNEIRLLEIRCQAKTLNTTSLSQKQFNIHPKSHALTIAYQDNRVQSDFRTSSSKFKVYDITNNDYSWEQKLSRFYIQYDGEVLPNPIPDIRVNGVDSFISQRYWETQKYKIMQFDNIETIEDWKKRGPYYHFVWPRKNEGAMEVQVSQEFTGNLPENGAGRPQLLLFEHYICKYKFDLYQGYITDVKKLL